MPIDEVIIGAAQIGGVIFRANATGTFLEGQPVAKLCGKASATKPASCSFVQLVDENDVMVRRLLHLKGIINPT